MKCPCGEIFDMRGQAEVARHMPHINQAEASRVCPNVEEILPVRGDPAWRNYQAGYLPETRTIEGRSFPAESRRNLRQGVLQLGNRRRLSRNQPPATLQASEEDTA